MSKIVILCEQSIKLPAPLYVLHNVLPAMLGLHISNYNSEMRRRDFHSFRMEVHRPVSSQPKKAQAFTL